MELIEWGESVLGLTVCIVRGGGWWSECWKCHRRVALSGGTRYGHTIKSTPHPIPNCEVKLDGPVPYWGGGPPGEFVVLYLLLLCCSFCFSIVSGLVSSTDTQSQKAARSFILSASVLWVWLLLQNEKREMALCLFWNENAGISIPPLGEISKMHNKIKGQAGRASKTGTWNQRLVIAVERKSRPL